MMTKVIHVCTGGPLRRIRVGKKVVLFQFHDYLGPVVLTSKWEEKEPQPGEGDPFWDAFQSWFDTGKRVSNAGYCIKGK